MTPAAVDVLGRAIDAAPDVYTAPELAHFVLAALATDPDKAAVVAALLDAETLAAALHGEFWDESVPREEGEACCLPSAERILAALAADPDRGAVVAALLDADSVVLTRDQADDAGMTSEAKPDPFAAEREDHVWCGGCPLGSHCISDGAEWPCPTARLLAIESAARAAMDPHQDLMRAIATRAALRDALGED